MDRVMDEGTDRDTDGEMDGDGYTEEWTDNGLEEWIKLMELRDVLEGVIRAID